MEYYPYNNYEGLKRKIERSVVTGITSRKERQERKLYYEVYVDSLFLVNFVMNLLMLELVNLTLMCTATRRRVVAGAAAGAVIYLLPFMLSGPGWLKLFLGLAAGTAVMIEMTFRLRNLKAFFKTAEKLLLYSFLVGGILLFIIRCFPGIRNVLMNIFGVMGMGVVVFLEIARLIRGKGENSELCRVVLTGRGVRITVSALIDTGNGLVEPISGKPVSVLEKSVFEGLWREKEPGGFRVIPYHSVGKKNGILQGYLIPQIEIEKDGMVKICRDVYVGISDEYISCSDNYKMILNPRLLV